jgi:hypothetical protein
MRKSYGRKATVSDSICTFISGRRAKKVAPIPSVIED